MTLDCHYEPVHLRRANLALLSRRFEIASFLAMTLPGNVQSRSFSDAQGTLSQSVLLAVIFQLELSQLGLSHVRLSQFTLAHFQ